MNGLARLHRGWQRRSLCQEFWATTSIALLLFLGAFTVSIGVAGFPLQGSRNGDLLEAADKALDPAKKGDRNRLELAAAGVPCIV